MTVTRFGKAIAYAVVTLALIGYALWTVAPLYEAEEIVRAYLRSDLLLFVAACSISGTGVYGWMAYTRRRPAHRADSRFFMAVGALLLVTVVIVVLRFGGLTEENFDPSSAAMINLNLMLAGILPLPFLVRTWVLVPGCERGVKRGVAVVFAVAVAALYLALIILGKLLHTVTFAA